MFKFQLWAILFFAALTFVACKGAAPETSTETTTATSASTDATPKPEAPKTSEFVSTEGRYSITFPGAPKEQRQQIPIEGVGNIEMVAMMYEPSNNKVYMVAHADYPEAMVNEAKKADKGAVHSIVENAKKGAVGQMGLTIRSEKPATIDGNEGVAFNADNGSIYTSYEIFLVGNRLYQIAILSQGAPVAEADATSFIGTFKLAK